MLKLTLKNFRRFLGPQEVTFPSGLTIIGGPNGAGKSTLITALVYALFGASSDSKHRSDGIYKDSTVEVTCDLTLDGKVVKVRRIASQSELHLDGALQIQRGAGSKTQVNRALLPLLGGLSRKQFESTFIAMQGDTAGLVEGSDSTRKEIIEKVLQLEVLKRAIEQQDDRRAYAKETVRAKGHHLSDTLGLGAEPRTALEDALKLTKEHRAHAQAFLNAVSTAVKDRDAQLAEAEGEAKLAKEIEERRLATLQELSGQVESSRKALGTLEELEREDQKLREELGQIDGQLVQVRKNISDIQIDINTAEGYEGDVQRDTELRGEFERLNARLEHLHTVREHHDAIQRAMSELGHIDSELAKLANIDAELVGAQTAQQEVERNYTDLEADPTTQDAVHLEASQLELGSQEEREWRALNALREDPEMVICPTCRQPLSIDAAKKREAELLAWLEVELPQLKKEIEKKRRNLKAQRSEWLKAKKAAKEACNRAREQVVEVGKKIAQCDRLHSDRTSAEADLKKAHGKWQALGEEKPYDPEEAAALQRKRAGIVSEREALEPKVSHYKMLSHLHENLKKAHAKELKLIETQRNLELQRSDLGFDPECLKNHKKVHKDLESDFETARQDHQEAKARHAQALTRVSEAKGACKQARDGQGIVTEAFETLWQEVRLLEALSDFKTHFFEANTRQVAERASQLISLAVSDGSIRKLEFVGGKLYYTDINNTRREVAPRLSGGEKALVGLCLRIALAERAQVITKTGKVRFLVLDEVLGSLDEERREAVQRIFHDVLARGVLEHIVMVTHLEAVKTGWQAHLLEVVKGSGTISEVVPVGALNHEAALQEEV